MYVVSKVLAVGCEEGNAAIRLNYQTLEEVESFPSLGSSINKSGRDSAEVDIRLEEGGRVYQMWRKVFRSANLSKATEMRVSSSM